ncbi:hypothetical protein GCM10010530_84480 [Kribbella aluminosa]
MRVVTDAALPEEQELVGAERLMEFRGDFRRDRSVEIHAVNLSADVVREWSEPHASSFRQVLRHREDRGFLCCELTCHQSSRGHRLAQPLGAR